MLEISKLEFLFIMSIVMIVNLCCLGLALHSSYACSKTLDKVIDYFSGNKDAN